MKNRKKIIFVSIIVIIIIGFGLFFATSQEKTDVYLKDFEVSADGKTMTLKIGVSNNTGYVKKMKRTNGSSNEYYTFYSTYGINSKIGAKDTFKIELDDDIDEIYFYTGDKEYEKKLLDFSHIELDYCEEMSNELFNLINELKRTNNQKIITEISFLKMCLMKNKKENTIKNSTINTTSNIDSNNRQNQVELIVGQEEQNIEESSKKETDENKKIKINNVFCGPSKELKNNFVKNYEKG